MAGTNNQYAKQGAPKLAIDGTKTYTVSFETSMGNVEAELYPDTAPMAVNNFVFLAREGFFDGVIFHRIIPGFVVQGGDPTGTGTGGPGYKFKDEPIPAHRNYEKGTLAMANAGPNTNGSQFFICLDDLTTGGKLPKNYTIFGKVTSGMDVVDRMAQARTGPGDRPMQDITMTQVTVNEN